jgi:hypothetical protein
MCLVPMCPACCRAAYPEHKLADGLPDSVLVCNHHHLHCGARHQVAAPGQGNSLRRLGSCHGGESAYLLSVTPKHTFVAQFEVWVHVMEASLHIWHHLPYSTLL